MIAHKHGARLAALLMALAVFLCVAATAFGEQINQAAGGAGVTMQYESQLFDTSEPLSVNLILSEESWQEMLDNASAEEYVSCDVEINGELFKNVGIRPKGNTSLSSIASDPDTDRYSFKLEFDHYVDGQTCYGLDKLILNNNYADATNMKEALVYDLYAALGADASLYNYARLSVNGEYWGVYLALEAVEESFLLRNYGVKYGQLYKPDSMEMGGGKGNADKGQLDFPANDLPGQADSSAMGDMPSMPEGVNGGDMPTMPEGMNGGDMPTMPEGMNGGDAPTMPEGMNSGDAPTMPEGMNNGDAPTMPDETNRGGGFSSGSGGANLNYTDDNLDSYSTIWDGEVTDSSQKDHQRVVAALKSIAAGENLDEVMDVENLVAYAAVHIFSVNDDSLSGSMAHNYYLYESDGQLNLIPWDYNLAFGGMQGGTATSMVNEPIDDAFDCTEFFDALMADETYHAQYEEALRRVVEYVNGGALDEFYTRTRSQLDALVQEDPTAFYSYEEYDEAASTLYELVKLRAQSIEAQLDGEIPSRQSERSNADQLIDASGYSLSAMGSMNNGGGRMDRRSVGEVSQTDAPPLSPSFSDAGGNQTPPASNVFSGDGSAQMLSSDALPEGGDLQSPAAESDAGNDRQTNARADENGQTWGKTDKSMFSRGNGQNQFSGTDGFSQGAQQSSAARNLAIYGLCFLLMLAALFFASRFRRNGR